MVVAAWESHQACGGQIVEGGLTVGLDRPELGDRSPVNAYQDPVAGAGLADKGGEFGPEFPDADSSARRQVIPW